jgi:hypothetical protein
MHLFTNKAIMSASIVAAVQLIVLKYSYSPTPHNPNIAQFSCTQHSASMAVQIEQGRECLTQAAAYLNQA